MKKLILASCLLLSLLLGRAEAAVRDLGEACSRTDGDSCVHPEQKLVCDRLTATCVLAEGQSCGRHGQTSVGTAGLCASDSSCLLLEEGRRVCVCGEGYTATDGYCDIGAEMYGGPCDGDGCFDHTLTCRNTSDTVKRCDCVKGRKPDIFVTATCPENFISKGALCSFREDCSTTKVDAYECVGGRCECALGYNALYNEECVEITDLVAGKWCDQNSGSGCGERNVTHLQCSPTDGVCTCVGGYVGVTGNECYPAAGELYGGCIASTPGTRGSCLGERHVCIQDDVDGPMYCQDLCLLPKETGMCRGYFPSLYYNSETGACEQFVYGGCQGNSNRFSTKEECEETCVDDICQLSKAEGPCEAYMPSYFYNRETGACEQFIYGGCQGNENRFGTEKECQAACVKDKCQLPKEAGPCRAYIPSYFHNKETGACEQFIYGGCQGNENRFGTEEECKAACVKDICQLPKDTGPCRASKPRFFYNWETGACEQFNYGGCQGNENRFETEEECQAACVKDVCQLPRITGPCRASIPSYFYNSETGACEQFTYGGCEGNGNRFGTQEECQAACVKDVCQLPPESGMCKAYFPMYFYNSTSQACEEFVYGGCQGNDNRFDNKTQCEKACGKVKDPCQQPKQPGKCRGYFPRYFYNSASKTCEEFVYGGCVGNENNFESLRDCRHACQKELVCQQPKRSGRCEALIGRYFYNTVANECEYFTYGGCDGNDNNFEEKTQCQQTCRKDTGGSTGLHSQIVMVMLAVIIGWSFIRL